MERTVLLIDDDAEEHEIFKLALGNFDSSIQFISALNGHFILNHFEEIAPDWIFLDINMPGMNGLETLHEIKKIESLKNTPVFIYSTSDGFRHGALAMSLGAKRYVRKPNKLTDLQQLLKDILK